MLKANFENNKKSALTSLSSNKLNNITSKYIKNSKLTKVTFLNNDSFDDFSIDTKKRSLERIFTNIPETNEESGLTVKQLPLLSESDIESINNKNNKINITNGYNIDTKSKFKNNNKDLSLNKKLNNSNDHTHKTKEELINSSSISNKNNNGSMNLVDIVKRFPTENNYNTNNNANLKGHRKNHSNNIICYPLPKLLKDDKFINDQEEIFIKEKLFLNKPNHNNHYKQYKQYNQNNINNDSNQNNQFLNRSVLNNTAKNKTKNKLNSQTNPTNIRNKFNSLDLSIHNITTDVQIISKYNCFDRYNNVLSEYNKTEENNSAISIRNKIMKKADEDFKRNYEKKNKIVAMIENYNKISGEIIANREEESKNKGICNDKNTSISIKEDI